MKWWLVLWVRFPLEATLFFAGFETSWCQFCTKNARNVGFVLFTKNSNKDIMHPGFFSMIAKIGITHSSWKLTMFSRNFHLQKCYLQLHQTTSRFLVLHYTVQPSPKGKCVQTRIILKIPQPPKYLLIIRCSNNRSFSVDYKFYFIELRLILNLINNCVRNKNWTHSRLCKVH